MKTAMKTLVLVTFLSLAAGAAQAGGCPLDSAAPAARQMMPVDMGRIEAALRSGQITPYEAGRLMRQQWEIAQFQRGFLEGDQAPRAAMRGGGCGGSDLSINLAPLGDMAGTMAKNGVQTASKVMRALMRETERLIQEKAAAEGSEL